MMMTRMRTSDIDNNDDDKNNNNNNEMTRTWDKDATIKKKTRTVRDDDDEGLG